MEETNKCSVCKKECPMHQNYSYREDGMDKLMWACSKECHQKFSDDLQTRVTLKEMNEIANELI